MVRKVQGVGINDADYVTQTKRNDDTGQVYWKCPYYNRWKIMLMRCYSHKLHEKRPTYRGCSVCDGWLYFSNFKAWMEKQDWKDKHLDKDFIIGGNKVYSPDTCVFIDGRLNGFITLCGASRGDHPLGVYWDKNAGKYKSQCSDGSGLQKHLGLFTGLLEAHKAWQKAKLEAGYNLLSQQTDSRIIEALKRILTKLQYEYDNNMETLTL